MGSPLRTRTPTPELLRSRIRDLNLRLKGSSLELPVARLYRELAGRGLVIRPLVYLGDEWFSPEGECAISIPFYLAHPRLLRLEQEMSGEVEGERPADFMKLLRHEAGHCFEHAYSLSGRRQWRGIFGDARRAYRPETYRADPATTDFVYNLERWYAQAHPCEDFAETFAVWLNPRSQWKKRYAQWPSALRKLQYIDRLATELAAAPTPRAADEKHLDFRADRMNMTLGSYYRRRKSENFDVRLVTRP